MSTKKRRNQRKISGPFGLVSVTPAILDALQPHKQHGPILVHQKEQGGPICLSCNNTKPSGVTVTMVAIVTGSGVEVSERVYLMGQEVKQSVRLFDGLGHIVAG